MYTFDNLKFLVSSSSATHEINGIHIFPSSPDTFMEPSWRFNTNVLEGSREWALPRAYHGENASFSGKPAFHRPHILGLGWELYSGSWGWGWSELTDLVQADSVCRTRLGQMAGSPVVSEWQIQHLTQTRQVQHTVHPVTGLRGCSPPRKGPSQVHFQPQV